MPVLRLLSLRLRFFFSSFASPCSCIATYLFHLQIRNMQQFYRMGQQNFMRQEAIVSARGNIVDIKENCLPRARRIIRSIGRARQSSIHTHQHELIKALSTCFTSATRVRQDFYKKQNNAEARLLIVPNVPFAQLTKLIERFPQDPNIHLEKRFKRCYPHRDLACHIVGYLGLDDRCRWKDGA